MLGLYHQGHQRGYQSFFTPAVIADTQEVKIYSRAWQSYDKTT